MEKLFTVTMVLQENSDTLSSLKMEDSAVADAKVVSSNTVLPPELCEPILNSSVSQEKKFLWEPKRWAPSTSSKNISKVNPKRLKLFITPATCSALRWRTSVASRVLKQFF